MKRTFAVVGLGTLGAQLVRSLYEGGADVIALDKDEDAVSRVKDTSTQAICVDVANEQALDDAGVFEVDVAILALRRNFEITVLGAFMCKKRGVQEIIVHVDSDLEAQVVRAIGATSVVFPERDLARYLAEKLLHPKLTDHVSLGHDVDIAELQCPQRWVGKTLADLRIRKKHDVVVVAIRQDDANQDVQIVPSPDEPLRAGNVLVVLGRSKALDAFVSSFGE
ncbi:MAG: TrkA family potassium uptake protein [Candidatus Hydrogenedentes bacterium]|nr:TrkA family potassium uptake protein [Candidatus Hydrogenedentota bacterium]